MVLYCTVQNMNKSTYTAIIMLLYSYQVPVMDSIRKERGDFTFKLLFPSIKQAIKYTDIVARKFNLDPTTISYATKKRIFNELIDDELLFSQQDQTLGTVKTCLNEDIHNSIRRKIQYSGDDE